MTIYEKMNAVVLSNEKILNTLTDTIGSYEPCDRDKLYNDVQRYMARLENDMDMITYVFARNDDELSIANTFEKGVYCTLYDRYEHILKSF